MTPEKLSGYTDLFRSVYPSESPFYPGTMGSYHAGRRIFASASIGQYALLIMTGKAKLAARITHF